MANKNRGSNMYICRFFIDYFHIIKQKKMICKFVSNMNLSMLFIAIFGNLFRLSTDPQLFLLIFLHR